MFAVSSSDGFEISQLLLASGADVTHVDDVGYLPIANSSPDYRGI